MFPSIHEHMITLVEKNHVRCPALFGGKAGLKVMGTFWYIPAHMLPAWLVSRNMLSGLLLAPFFDMT